MKPVALGSIFLKIIWNNQFFVLKVWISIRFQTKYSKLSREDKGWFLLLIMKCKFRRQSIETSGDIRKTEAALLVFLVFVVSNGHTTCVEVVNLFRVCIDSWRSVNRKKAREKPLVFCAPLKGPHF